MRILRTKDVVERVGLSRVTVWRLERAGKFPRRRQVTSGAVGWFEAEVDEWLSQRPLVRPTEDQARAEDAQERRGSAR